MVEPYLNFSGKSNEAIEYYEQVFGGTNKKVMYYKDAPANPDFIIPDYMKDLVLHGIIEIEGTVFHFSDTQQNTTVGDAISLLINVKTAERVLEIFAALKKDGEVLMEAEPAFFSPMYGWVKDKFGIGWQIICQ